MRTLAVGLWKEWRDHRVVCIALFVALPVLVLTSAWAFGDDVVTADFGGLTLFALSVAQALYVFSVASESFGGERRRGTLDFLRRLPRGLGRAFTAKLAMYALGTACALLWGAAVAWAACAWFGPERAVPDFANALLLPDPMIVAVTTALFALGAWTLLVSNMIPQGGAATIGAAILLGLLGLPVFFALRQHPWLLPEPGPDLLLAAAAWLAAPAFVALAYAFLRGNRLLANAWSPSWRGLAVVGVIACGGYAWGAVERARALTLDPQEEEFRIEEALLGKGGRYLFLTVYRGPYAYFNPHSGMGTGSPHQPWIADLTDGSWRAAGDFYAGWGATLWTNRHVPQPIVKRFAYVGNEIGWFDGETGELRKVLPHDVRTPDVLRWQRESMPAVAWHRDADGRALWLEGATTRSVAETAARRAAGTERLVREGEDAPLEAWFPGKSDSWYQALPGGWYTNVFTPDRLGRTLIPAYQLWDAATGKTWTAERHPGRTAHELILSPQAALRVSRVAGPRGKQPQLEPWTLVDLKTGAVTPAANPPDVERLLAPLPGDRALLMVGTDKARLVLSVWDPRTGETVPVLDDKGEPFVGHLAEMAGTAPGDLSVVKVWNDRTRSSSVAVALLDGATGRAHRLPLQDERFQVVCIESRDALVTLDFSQKVHRWTFSTHRVGLPPGFGVETLFPKRP